MAPVLVSVLLLWTDTMGLGKGHVRDLLTVSEVESVTIMADSINSRQACC